MTDIAQYAAHLGKQSTVEARLAHMLQAMDELTVWPEHERVLTLVRHGQPIPECQL